MITCIGASAPCLFIVFAVATFIVGSVVSTVATLTSTHLGGACIAGARGSVLGESLGSDFEVVTLNVHVHSSLIVEVVK